MNQPELYIISDVHLCDGSRLEDFSAEDERALLSFLFHISRRPSASLIINGDFIDFVQIQPRPRMWFNNALDASEAESLEKLEHAMNAHGPVFDALGRFVNTGHALRFHYGNHDIDLVWPRVQQTIRERLGKKNTHSRVTFGEHYVDSSVYIEHGHQADAVNSFPTQPQVTHIDPQGVPRLERCWGTRLVEEFYNKIEVLDGCDMLDNIRPRMQAAIIIIKHALLHPHLHATLYTSLHVIVDTLASLQTEQDVVNAAEQLGVPVQILGWLASVAGWFSTQAHTEYVAKSHGTPQLRVPWLQKAYTYGTGVADGAQLARIAPQAMPVLTGKSADSVGHTIQQREAQAEYNSTFHRPFLRRAAKLGARYADLRAICFGHTHRSVADELQVDLEPGWPLTETSARYYNSGSWTRTLNLSTVDPKLLTFGLLSDRKNYAQGRDYLRVTWPGSVYAPVVDTLVWQ